MSEKLASFDSYLSRHYARVVKQTDEFRARRRHYFIHNYRRFLPEDPEQQLLDIGPGYGELIEALARDLGYRRVQGVDLSEEVVRFCNEIVPESCSVAEDTTVFLNDRPNMYAGIFMMHIIEHVTKTEIIPLLSSVSQALMPNGCVMIEVPNMSNPFTGSNARYADFTHEVGFTEMSLTHVLEAAGFSQVETFAPKLPWDRIGRLPQMATQLVLDSALRLAFTAYSYPKPRILAPTLCAVAYR